MSEIPRVCATCKHFGYDTGTERDEDGADPYDWVSMVCRKNRWTFEPIDATDNEFRSMMIAAADCPDYEAMLVLPLKVRQTPQSVPNLAALYPAFEIGVTGQGPWKAWYDRGAGRTTSGGFTTEAEAVEWLAVRLAEMTRAEVSGAE